LLKEGKAKVLRREPSTIILLFGSSEYRQEVVSNADYVDCSASPGWERAEYRGRTLELHPHSQSRRLAVTALVE
jgi:hypothetical protein